MDPPSYILNRLKDAKIYEKEVIQKTAEIENILKLKISNINLKTNAQRIKIVF